MSCHGSLFTGEAGSNLGPVIASTFPAELSAHPVLLTGTQLLEELNSSREQEISPEPLALSL